MGEVGKMASSCSLGLVLVEFEYEYMGRDGCMVYIKPNERYTLLAKTNDHWWHVRRDERAKPFYIPAKYVKELPATLPSPLDFVDPPGPETKPPAPELTEKAKPNEVTIRLRSPGNCRKTENRMSTFGVPLDIHEPPSYLHGGLTDSLLSLHPAPTVPTIDAAQQKKRLSLAPNLLFGSKGVPIDDASQKSRVPSFSPADPIPRQAKPVEPPSVKNLNESRHQALPPKPEPIIEPEEESSPEPTVSSDSENIYESIQDLKLDDLIKTEETSAAQEPVISAPESVPQTKPENENPTTAVYANVTDLKKTARSAPSSSSTCSSPGLSLSPGPDSASSPDPVGWEVHTDQDSGKAFYYHPATQQSSWEDPRSTPPPAGMEASPLPAAPSTSASPALSQGSDWEQLLDETTGRHYYYNHSLKQTTWEAPEPQIVGPPPLPEEDYPTEQPQSVLQPSKDVQLPHGKQPVVPRVTVEPGAPVPAGWTCSTESGGKTVFTNEHTHQQWIQSKDDKGQTYYYSKDGFKSQWTLPKSPVLTGPPPLGNGVDSDNHHVLKNWRHTMGPFNTSYDDAQKFFPSHRRIASDYASEVSTSGNSPEIHQQEEKLKLRRNLSGTDAHHHHHGSLLDKAGILNKTKVADHGKKLRKNWTQSWTVLHGGILTFHKDPKSTPGGNVTKTNQIVTEYTVELKGASVYWASKEKSSKKNVLELKTRHGSEYLIQYDTDSIIHDWYKIIQDTIRHLDHEHYSEEEEDEVIEKAPHPVDREKKGAAVRQSSAAGDTEQGRVRTKLRKFLQRRPTLQSVKDKGYIKDNVFGCHLDTLCHRENTTVPRFVEKCIRTVERRGLNIDGIYRVSGNLAVIQKLRHKADHEEDLDLDDGQWEEIHVITGALKLFFRELPEPLFPYSFFDKFLAAIKISDYSQKVSYMKDLVRSLPLPNHNTMEVLFKHLRKVIEHGDSNRMSVQSTAIVFGPTLLRPEEESGNITIHMVFQNQIVELILNEFSEIFHPR